MDSHDDKQNKQNQETDGSLPISFWRIHGKSMNEVIAEFDRAAARQGISIDWETGLCSGFERHDDDWKEARGLHHTWSVIQREMAFRDLEDPINHWDEWSRAANHLALMAWQFNRESDDAELRSKK